MVYFTIFSHNKGKIGLLALKKGRIEGILSILRQFNWLDILALVIVIRIAYIAFKLGFTAENIKLPGTLLGLSFAFHYYSLLAFNFYAEVNPPRIGL